MADPTVLSEGTGFSRRDLTNFKSSVGILLKFSKQRTGVGDEITHTA